MPDITFEFSLHKLIQAIALFSDLHVPDLTKLKIAKLLYFADKSHLLAHGSPILGDVYFCMDFGPVPSFSLNEMNEAISEGEVSTNSTDATLIHQSLRVKRRVWAKYPHFESKKACDLSVFSASEVSVLREVAATRGPLSAKVLVDQTHLEPTWRIPNGVRSSGCRERIPYELFFEGCDELGRKHLAQLMVRFHGEAIPLSGDVDYRDFTSRLLEDPDVDWSLDRDQVRQRIQYAG